MPLKHYRSESTTIFDTIQKTLAAHKAKQIFFEYDDAGRVTALAISLDVDGQRFGFRLPARIENVERILYGTGELPPQKRDQAYRTAWANIRDWLTAQMALLDTGMVRAEEIFLPYMLDRQGQTYFEALERRRFALGPGEQSDSEARP